MKEYKKLNKYENYDQEAAEELAEAMNELSEIMKRATVLKDLMQENKELHPFLWTTADGRTIALHKIEDDHLKNILTHIVGGLREIPKSIKSEARRRGFDIPSNERRQHVLGMYSSSDNFQVDEADVIDF